MGRKSKHSKNREIIARLPKTINCCGLREGHSLLYNEYAIDLLGIISKESDICKLNDEIRNLRLRYIQLLNDFSEYAMQQDLDVSSREKISEQKKIADDTKGNNMVADYGLSIIDIEKYLLKLLGISITTEEELVRIFGNGVVKCYEKINVISFKDNLSPKASDDIVCMNYALLFVYDFYYPNNLIHGIPLCSYDLQDKLIQEIEKGNDNGKDYSKAITICYEALSKATSFFTCVSNEVTLLCYALKFSSTDNTQSYLYTIMRIGEKIRSADLHNDMENKTEIKKDDKSLMFSKMAKKLREECKECSNKLINLYIERIRNLDLNCFELSDEEDMISNSTIGATNRIRSLYDQQDYTLLFQHLTFVLLSMPKTTFLEIAAQLLVFLKTTGRKYYASIKNLFNCNETKFNESLVKKCSELEFIEALDDYIDINLVVAVTETFAELRLDLEDWLFFDEVIHASIHNKEWFITMYEIVNRLYIHEEKEEGR